MTETDFTAFKENATFIVGHPRSGTTFLRTLLDHHPQLVVFPVESHFFDWVDSEDKVEAFFKRTSFEKHCKKYFNADIQDVMDRLRDKFRTENSKKDVLLSLIEVYYEIENSEKKDKRRWVEKTPSHISLLPTLKKWFADHIKVIYIYRDPRDIFVSIKKKYPYRTMSEVCSSYNYYYRLHFSYEKYHNWFFSVKYEGLLNKPEETLKGLCKFLDIEINSNLLRPTINGKSYPGNSRFGKKLAFLSKSPIGRYMNYLSKEEVGHIESFLNNPMRSYGYISNKTKKIYSKDYYLFLLLQEIRLLKQRIKWLVVTKFNLSWLRFTKQRIAHCGTMIEKIARVFGQKQ